MRNPIDRFTEGLPHGTRVAIDWIVTIAGAIAIVLAIKAWVINPYRIPSSSMEPTLHCAQPEDDCLAGASDRVLANRLIYRYSDPKRGDVVVFNTPPEAIPRCGAGGTFVKRVVVLPNEVWEMRRGTIFVNGKRLVEPYLQPDRLATDTTPPRRVPPDSYVMLGDNRPHSCDSRAWGPVGRKNLIGKVFAVYWPPGRVSLR